MDILAESRRRLDYARVLIEEKSVMEILSKFGNPLLVGSIAMETVWARDIDIVVEADDIRGASLEALEEFIGSKRFSKYQYGDFVDYPRENRPEGYIINLFHRGIDGQLWEFEIWFLEDISYYKKQLEEWKGTSKDRGKIIIEKAIKAESKI